MMHTIYYILYIEVLICSIWAALLEEEPSEGGLPTLLNTVPLGGSTGQGRLGWGRDKASKVPRA